METYEDFYRRVGKLQGWDFSKLRYEVEDNSEFNYFSTINNACNENTVLLDVGTGGGEKILRNLKLGVNLVGIDNCKEMIERANENLKLYPERQARFLLMDVKNLEFKDNTFDIVCSRHCWDNPKQAYRLLKKSGKYIAEEIEVEDCLELKKLFGRGQNFNRTDTNEDSTVRALMAGGFQRKDIKTYKIRQSEYYKTEDDLLYLLMNTPILMDFLKVKGDETKFRKYVSQNTFDNGILLKRKLIGVVAEKLDVQK